MSASSLLRILGYGALAGAVLLCLHLISLAPIALDWGRELIGASIALVAVLIGVALSRGRTVGPPEPDEPAAAPSSTSPERNAADRPAEGPPVLSPREQEVLALLCTGQSNKQIARALHLSENTVKTHLGNLYGKLGVSRRTEALVVAQRLGLGPD